MGAELKKSKEDEGQLNNVPQLICRICDQKMLLDKFLVSSETNYDIVAYRTVPKARGKKEAISQD